MMTTPAQTMIEVDGVAKSFTLHLRGGTVLPVMSGVRLSVDAGECVVLGGPSGAGKSSLLRMIFGNYGVDAGHIAVRDGDALVDVVTASPRRLVALRRRAMSYVSQFLRVIPRVGSHDIVARAAAEGGLDAIAASARADVLLSRLNVPQSLWRLPPATFSGGEQQRINIARGFAVARPILLLDEPTASLDAGNRQVVVGMINDAKRAGAAVLGIFHDEDVRDEIASRIVDITQFKPQ